MLKKLMFLLPIFIIACGEQVEPKKSVEKEKQVPTMNVDLSVPGGTPMTTATFGKDVDVMRFTISQNDVEKVTDTNGFLVEPWVPEIVTSFQYRGLKITDCRIYSSEGSLGDEREIKEIHPPTLENDKDENRSIRFHPGQPQFPKGTILDMTMRCGIESDGTLPNGYGLQYAYIIITEVVVGIANVKLEGAAFSSFKF